MGNNSVVASYIDMLVECIAFSVEKPVFLNELYVAGFAL